MLNQNENARIPPPPGILVSFQYLRKNSLILSQKGLSCGRSGVRIPVVVDWFTTRSIKFRVYGDQVVTVPLPNARNWFE